MRLEAGARIGPYEVTAKIGQGGMGEVYRARDTKLHRDVALKVLAEAFSADPDRLARFEREARILASLNHPYIGHILGMEDAKGVRALVLELVEGPTLADRIAQGPIPELEAMRIAGQIALALESAHRAGVIHRDLKPANIKLQNDGTVKVLDFGLARRTATADAPTETGPALTEAGMLLGTLLYMAPEQLRGQQADARSDIWALGAIVYEMLAGRRPFAGRTSAELSSAILREEPPPLRRLHSAIPPALERLVVRCLDKDPEGRYPSATAVVTALRDVEQGYARARGGLFRSVATRVGAAAGAILLASAGAAWLWEQGADRRWAERDAIAEITNLIGTGDLYAAYRTALRAAEFRAGDPELEQVIDSITLPIVVNTDPPGAEVSVKAYGVPDSAWTSLGVTPMNMRAPYQMMHWRIAKAGFEPFEGAPYSASSLSALGALALDAIGTRPAGTVRIPGGPLERIELIAPTEFLAGTVVEPYYLDRHEVTNRQFQAFVDAGGYRRREWWPEATTLTRNGVEVSWDEALDAFRDPTGRPGPSTWELGRYADGEAEEPVSGISWFEAAAYCAYAGGDLPTVYHWFRAIGQEQFSDILVHSNMDGSAKAPVGRFAGMSAYGAYDMAGNVKEWVWNATDDDLRYILGGSWNEPTYLFKHLVAQDPWNRERTNGVRCAHYPEAPAEPLRAPVAPLREYQRPEPISDDAFDVLRGMYTYDPDPLEASVERTSDSHPGYRRETVSIRTAYGDQRMEVHLLLPRGVPPPYQSVVWFPGDDVFVLRSSDQFSSAWLFDFLPRAGRAVVSPVYRGMYERFEPWERTPGDWRDMVISWAQDIGRTIDYLETRSDFDATKIAYYGFSAGANYAPVFAAVEPRFAVSMFIGGGLIPVLRHPAMHHALFGPRALTPTLMINGRDDFLLPYDISQRPFFEMLGAPPDSKRHARLAGGHIPSDTREIIREVLDWLDAHLGPVPPASPR